MSLPVESSTKPLVGWRGWNVIQPGFLTTSSITPTLWLPNERTEAVCRDHQELEETIPHHESWTCKVCGIYAFNSPEEIFKQNYSKQTVLGEVWLWGKVIECRRGFRAQYACPKKLYATKAMLDANQMVAYLAFRYDIELEEIPANHPLVAPPPPSAEEMERIKQQAAAQRRAEEERMQRMQMTKLQKAQQTKTKRSKLEAQAARMPATRPGFANLLEEIEWDTAQAVKRKLGGL